MGIVLIYDNALTIGKVFFSWTYVKCGNLILFLIFHFDPNKHFIVAEVFCEYIHVKRISFTIYLEFISIIISICFFVHFSQSVACVYFL